MAQTETERVREMARLVGVTVAENELAEVADRFYSLLKAMEDLAGLDLAAIQPVTIFADESDDAA